MRYMRHKKSLLAISVILLMVFSSCATLDIRNMKPKDYATIAMGVYVQQFERHQEKSVRTDLTDQERKDLQKLKNDLIKLKSALDVANTAISLGDQPSQESMQAIMDFLEIYYYQRR